MNVFEGIRYPIGTPDEVWFEYNNAPFLLPYLNKREYKLETLTTTDNNEFYDGIIVLINVQGHRPKKWPLGYFKN